MIRCCNIAFKIDPHKINHDDPNLQKAKSVDLTFGCQKIQDEIVSQDRTDDHGLDPIEL